MDGVLEIMSLIVTCDWISKQNGKGTIYLFSDHTNWFKYSWNDKWYTLEVIDSNQFRISGNASGGCWYNFDMTQVIEENGKFYLECINKKNRKLIFNINNYQKFKHIIGIIICNRNI